MRVFITGGTGFAGSHLIDMLIEAGHEVHALVHAASSTQRLPARPGYRPVAGDLLDQNGLKAVVAAAGPDVIYHLAGQASPARSWEIPAQTVRINTEGTINLLEAAVGCGHPRVVIVTSAEIYGQVSVGDLPLTEASVPRPRHPYGVSKLAAAYLVPLYWQRYQLPVVEARPFNHIGPRQALGFVVPDFASQLAEIKRGLAPAVVSVGNLAAARDFTDVRDVVRAYMLLGESGRPGASYLICSGTPVSIETILQRLIAISEIEVAVQSDTARSRPSDTPVLYGSYAKIAADTGWAPRISLEQSLADAFADWLARV